MSPFCDGGPSTAVAMAVAMYGQDTEAQLVSMSLFQMLDADCSGHLSQKELLKTRAFMIRDEFLDFEHDINGDGVVDESEWHDFCGAVYELLGKQNYMAVLRQWLKEAPAADTTAAKAPAPHETEAASVKIQKVARGRQSRKAVAEKKALQASRKGKAKGYKTPNVPVITIAELWELLLLDNGKLVTTLAVGDLVNLFYDCKQSGLDTSLAKLVPMRFEERLEPEDLCPQEVAHICKLMLLKNDVSEQEVRAALAPLKHLRDQPCERVELSRLEGNFNLKRFRQLITLLSNLMRVDQEYMVTQMFWRATGHFETTDMLTAHLIYRVACANVPASELEAGAPEFEMESEVRPELPDMRTLEKKIGLEFFTRLVREGGVVNERGKSGITYGEIGIIFQRAVRNAPKRIQERMARRRKTGIELHPKPNEELIGRNEFEVLMEELYSAPGIRNMYPGPQLMMVDLAQRVRSLNKK